MKTALPGQMIRGRELASDQNLSADVIVVGSGAGGAMAASELAKAGKSVLCFEEGGYHLPSEFTQREGEMLPMLFQDSGGRATVDGAVSILQGRGVGGSTVHNTNLCKRAPAQVLAKWASEHGLKDWTEAALAPDYQAVEEALHVTQMTEADINKNNQILLAGMKKLGYRGGLLSHNRRGCQRSGFCELGCFYNAKENAHKVLIPQAIEHGARIYADVHIGKVLVEGGRVTGVLGTTVRQGSKGVVVKASAKTVVLAGSAIGSSALLLRSGVADPEKRVGKGLHLHPGLAVAGVFDEVVDGWRGIPQSVECMEMLSFDDTEPDRRSWIVAAFAHPAGYAAMQPGFGKGHAQLMREYRQTAVIAAMLHDETKGQVRVNGRGEPQVRYELVEGDARALFLGAVACGDILFAAGARRVMVPLTKPLLAESPKELRDVLLRHRYRPLDPLLTSVHPMGSLAMGEDPRASSCDGAGRYHHVRGLYVADGSLFPTSLGGPPQMTIYAAGRKVARAVVQDG